MRWSKVISLVGVHAEGEIGKVITGGVLDIPGNTILEKLRHLNEKDDSLRQFCTHEPRGTAQQSMNILLPPCDPNADAGFIVLQPDQCHAMSGSNAICVTTALLELGLLPMEEPRTKIVLDTAAGLVGATALCQNGKCRSVSLDMPDSYVDARDISLMVDGLGEVRVDIAFGGVFYLLVDPEPLGLQIVPHQARKLVEVGMRIHEAAKRQIKPIHPLYQGVEGIAYCMFAGRNEQRLTNATIMSPGRLDRSPCGTGSSARLALMYERGEIEVGETHIFRSTIGSAFRAELSGTSVVGTHPAIRPRITGRGWIFSREEIGVDPDDPFSPGHRVSDCWGPEVG